MTRNYQAETAASITALAQRILATNLCKEIILEGAFYAPYIPKFMTNPKYKFSRANWYIAEFDDRQYFEVEKWCAEQFGPHPKNPDAWSRWYHKYQDRIHFRDAKDYEWFLLRWS